VTTERADELAEKYLPHALFVAAKWTDKYGEHLAHEFDSAAMFGLAQAIEQYGDRPQFKRRLNAVIRNKLADVRTEDERYNVPDLPAGMSLDELPAKPRGLSGAERVELYDLLDALPAEDRELIEAYHLRGETLAQIGARVGKDASTVMRRLEKVMRRLQTLAEG
jgi:RNA polymerase sigma factor (sigma-70 family)